MPAVAPVPAAPEVPPSLADAERRAAYDEAAAIHLPARQVSNCTFGGADLDTLFISTARVGLTQEQLAVQALAGSVFAVRTSARGQVASLFRG